MKFLAISTIAALAVAAPEPYEKRQVSAYNTASALGVLETALPPSLVSLALTNPGAATTAIASQFAAGSTPSWFSGLPSDVQTYLTGMSASVTGAGASVLSSASSSAATAAGVTPPRISAGNSMPYGTNGTAGMGVAGMGTGASGASTPARTSSGSGSSSTGGSGSGSGSGSSGSGSGSGSSGGSSSKASTGGVSQQTAAVGMGIAGAMGVLGLVVL